jgi:integrase
MAAYAWGLRENFDFEHHLLSLGFLEEHTVGSLCDAMLLGYEHLINQAVRFASLRDPELNTCPVVLLPPKTKAVAANTANQRLIYVFDYFVWLSNFAISKLEYGKRQEYKDRREEMEDLFKNYTWNKTPSSPTMPLSEESERFLFEAIHPGSPKNVWRPEAQFRNYIILRLFIDTAIRRAELLSYYVRDFERENNILNLVKRVDDPADPRRDKPGVKTVGRSLRIEPKLSSLIQKYITEDRVKHKAARKHPFLFTSLQNGQPLSLAAVSKIVRALTAHQLLRDLSPHVLRHTWNDRFVRREQADGVDGKLIAARQRRLCGWSMTSAMPITYTEEETQRRFVELAEARQERYLK